ncbi:GyrI-like domain-containing protein [uncultured Friedmanniella sp.]|uniref:GyrI-like domain-containing protein n=1 Tax=uncultured Friedmanniella sp. TaxID=335381 RepID=UPI0035CC355F
MTTPQPGVHSVVEQDEQPFVGVTRTLSMARLKEASDEIPRLFGWLRERGIAPTGPPFVRFLVIDMAADMVVQAGVPVAAPVAADGEIEVGTLPAGRYVTVVHVGHYDGLYDATTQLLRWAGQQGLHFDKHPSEAGEVWTSRLEWYESDPAEQPDPRTWVTQLAFKLAD